MAVINARSAIPWRNKRTILTQEVLRILRNCSDQLPWSTICDHVSMFTARMQYSGYSEQFRAEVVRSALHAYDEMKDKDRKGEVPFYRGRVIVSIFMWERQDVMHIREVQSTETS